MNRAGFWTGAVLVSIGLGLFAWKITVLELPLAPSSEGGLWRVEFEIDARGDGSRGSVRLALPSSSSAQSVVDENVVSDGLAFRIRQETEQRIGIWSGRFNGIKQLVHGFRVQLDRVPRDADAPRLIEPEIEERYTRASGFYPADAPEVAEALEKLGVYTQRDLPGRARTVFGFVADEVQSAARGSEDALLALERREASDLGKARLLVTLLRASGIPARLARGVQLGAGAESAERIWTQARMGGAWVPMSPNDGFFERRPRDLVLLATGDTPLVRTSALLGVGYRVHAVRESLGHEEVAALMAPASIWLAPLSLYRLPLRTQVALRLLLLIPLGALLVAVARNVIGIATFGTFLPVLIALSFRETGLGYGAGMFASVIVLGYLSRLAMQRLHLLLVPRLCILLCVVILLLTLFTLLGRGFATTDLYAGVLFPIVILTLLVERFSITVEEEGFREALLRLLGSGAVVVGAYPVFRSEWCAHLMFGFPELIISLMGVLVWIGSYTGYRVAELFRFRSLAAEVPAR
jgi:hypothetical protein